MMNCTLPERKYTAPETKVLLIRIQSGLMNTSQTASHEAYESEDLFE